MRAEAQCWCAHVRPFETEALFCILMHKRERKVAIGTGRMVHRSITNSSLLVGEHFDDDPRLARLLDDPALAPVILYPSPAALDLDTASAPEARALFPHGKRPLVIVLDGTWTNAKQLLRHASRLGALPALRFTPTEPSSYDAIRHEPHLDCVSTLEAVHQVIDHFARLGIAAPPPGRAHDGMLDLLGALIHDELAFIPLEHRRP